MDDELFQNLQIQDIEELFESCKTKSTPHDDVEEQPLLEGSDSDSDYMRLDGEDELQFADIDEQLRLYDE